MEDKKQALLIWLQAVTESQINDIDSLKDGKIIQALLSRIEGFSFSPSSEEKDSWKASYNVLKEIYEQLNSFLQKNSKMALPEELTVMNLIEMAQGKTQEGLETLLHLVFIVCIQSELRSEVIPCIMKFPSSAQNQLMMIIKESTVDREEQDERESIINDYKQTIVKLEYAYNNLVHENEALRASLFEDQDRSRKNEELLLQMTKENQELNKELCQKNQMLIRHREELMLDKYGSVNEDLVQELKKELLEREQNYGQQIMNLKESVTSLKDQLSHLKKANSELIEEKASRSVVQGRSTDHTNCIPLQKHKAKVNEMLVLSKQATQKEMAVKLQNIKLKNQNAELQNKIKTLNEELYKKNQDFMISKDDGNKLKVQFFSRIRDNLKQKLEEFNLKQKNSGTNFFQEEP